MIPTERHRHLMVPPAEIAARVSAFQTWMQRTGVAVAWIDHPADRMYLAGSVQDGVVLVPASGEATFVVRKSVARATAESALTVVGHPGRKVLSKQVRDLAGTGSVALAMDVSSASTFAWLREETGAPIADLAPAIRLLRARKSSWEIEQLRESGKQAESIYADIPSILRAGMTELELSGAIEARLRSRGHAGTVRVRRPGSDIAALSAVSGESALYPTAFNGPVGGEGPAPAAPPGAGMKEIARGDTVMLDMVTWWNGYHTDHTRTWFVGRDIPDEARAAHRFCVEAYERIVDELRPGRRCDEIYRSVSAWTEERGEPPGFMGFDENRVRFFGHGVGLELDELPVIADGIDIELESGMVLAIEPKAFLRGIGPVGIENTCVITPAGVEILCRTSAEMITVV